MPRWDLPKEIGEELERLEQQAKTPFLWLPESYGSKAGGMPSYLQTKDVFYDRNGVIMEYIAQISTPAYISANGFGYISHSTVTGETYIDFQDT